MVLMIQDDSLKQKMNGTSIKERLCGLNDTSACLYDTLFKEYCADMVCFYLNLKRQNIVNA